MKSQPTIKMAIDLLTFNYTIMKKFLFLAVAVAMLTGCGKDVMETEAGAKRVSFEIEGNFASPVFTRGSLSADGQEMTDLWVFDYVDGQMVQEIHQSSTDADFGTPALSLAYGQHHLYFVVSRGVSPVVNGNIISWDSVRDTFWKSITVNVSGGSASSYSVACDRVVTKLKISVGDEVPDGTDAVVIMPERWYYGLNYLTGEPTAMRENEERSISVPTSYIGTTGQLAVSIFGFSSATEWTTPLTVSARDNDNDIIGMVTIASAPFMANRATEYSGSLFTSGSTFTITLNDEWDTPWSGTW